MQLQTISVLTGLYGTVMSLATDGGVVQEAMKMVKGLESQVISEVKMSSDKDEDEDEEDFEDEEITVENDEEISDEEQELREE
jgi:hypothetical protein